MTTIDIDLNDFKNKEILCKLLLHNYDHVYDDLIVSSGDYPASINGRSDIINFVAFKIRDCVAKGHPIPTQWFEENFPGSIKIYEQYKKDWRSDIDVFFLYVAIKLKKNNPNLKVDLDKYLELCDRCIDYEYNDGNKYITQHIMSIDADKLLEEVRYIFEINTNYFNRKIKEHNYMCINMCNDIALSYGHKDNYEKSGWSYKISNIKLSVNEDYSIKKLIISAIKDNNIENKIAYQGRTTYHTSEYERDKNQNEPDIIMATIDFSQLIKGADEIAALIHHNIL